MSLRSTVLGLASVIVLAACAEQPATETATAEGKAFDVGAFRAQTDPFVSAWNAGDQATLGTMIADDAVLMQPDGPPIEGRSAILATIADGYDIAMFQQSATVDEAIAVGDYAYARGTWTLSPTDAATEAGDEQAVSGKWSAIYKPAPDGGWQVWRWMWSQPSNVVATVE